MTIPATLYAVSITPFDVAGRIDEDGFARHLRRLTAAGVVPYLAGSGSGEANGLSGAERRRLFEIARASLGKDARLRYAAFEPRSLIELQTALEDVVDLSPEAVRLALPDLGHGHATTPAENRAYLQEALARLPLPVSLTVGDGQGGIGQSALEAIRRNPSRILSVETTTQDAGTISDLRATVGETPLLTQANASLPIALALGASGGFGPLLNLLPVTHVRLTEAAARGAWSAVASDVALIAAVQAVLRPFGTVIPIKAALSAFGHPAGAPRLPRLALDARETGEIAAALIRLGVPDAEGWS